MRLGGDCLKYLKRGWTRKEGRRNKDFKKERRRTMADLPQLLYAEICSEFYINIHSSFWGKTKKIS